MKTYDIPKMGDFCQAVCQEMGWSLSWPTMQNTFLKVIENNWFARVADENGEIQGLSMAMITPTFMDVSDKRVVEMAWHSHPKLPRMRRARIMVGLFDALEAWARGLGLPLRISTSTQATKKLLERRGYKVLEVCYGN